MRQLSIAAQLYLVIGLSTLAVVVVIGAALLGSGEMVAAGHRLHDRGAVAIKETSRLAQLFKEQKELVARAPAEIDLHRLQEWERATDVLDGPVFTLGSQIDAALDQLVSTAARTADAETRALSNARDRMIWTIVGVGILGVVTFIGPGIYLARRLTGQLGRIITEMRALSAGDLDSQIAADSDPDELGAMVRALVVFRHEMIASGQIAAELRRSQEHLARAQRIAHMGSDLRNLNTDEAEWSDELYNIFGVSRESFVPTTAQFLRLVHPDDRFTVLAVRGQIKSGVCPNPFEYRIIRPDGTVRHIYRETELIRDGAGSPLFLTGTCHDVTDIRAEQERGKALERQLMHSQKLEALGTLAGGVAHDLNNTLVPILALSKLAREELPENSAAHGDLATIIRASERARDLVKQILAFSRKQDLIKREIDLAGVTREALQMLRASLPATIEIIEQISEVPPLFGDAGELHQAVVNLVTNAAQAIGGLVGKISVSLRATSNRDLEPHSLTDQSVVQLSIADTGCGMDPATLDRVFEPFFTTKGVGDGTGLGLSVVHGIISGHGGTIAVRSTPGEGSEFILSLPARGGHDAPAGRETAAA